jgi:hypothetical protein
MILPEARVAGEHDFPTQPLFSGAGENGRVVVLLAMRVPAAGQPRPRKRPFLKAFASDEALSNGKEKAMG